jgi:glutaredoxin 3
MSKNKDIKVFSTPSCPYCVLVKDYLDKKDIKYEYIDLTQQQQWIQPMIKKSGQMGVPQLWIDNQVIVGFDVDAINKALKG